MRLPMLLTVCLLLAGCINPVQRAVVSPTSTPQSALPAPQEMADWRLTTDEIEYIRLFRVGYTRWTPPAAGALADAVTQYRAGHDILNNNQWRVQATEAAGRLHDAYLWFDPASPSARFQPFGDAIGETVATFKDAGDMLAQGIDEGDGAKIERAVQLVEQGVALLNAVETAFSSLIEPAGN